MKKNQSINQSPHQSITINGQPLKVGFSFKAIKNFEELANKPVTKCVTTWDHIIYFYATITALNPEFEQTFDEFINTLDNHPDLLATFQTIDATNAPKQATATTIKKKWNTKQISGLWMLFLLLSVSPVLVPAISIIAWIGASFWLLARHIAKIGKKHD